MRKTRWDEAARVPAGGHMGGPEALAQLPLRYPCSALGSVGPRGARSSESRVPQEQGRQLWTTPWGGKMDTAAPSSPVTDI